MADPSALDIAADLARTFEGLRLAPYLCPAGVPTIGFGATAYADGRRVTLDDPPITRAEAEALLRHELAATYAPAVARLCPSLHQAGPAAQAAIIDFTFNLGPGRLQTSTLRRRINAGDWHGARAELARWVRAAGRVMPGLVRRRAAEAALMPT